MKRTLQVLSVHLLCFTDGNSVYYQGIHLCGNTYFLLLLASPQLALTKEPRLDPQSQQVTLWATRRGRQLFYFSSLKGEWKRHLKVCWPISLLPLSSPEVPPLTE